MINSDYDADVAIVGYGPTGVAAANFLGGLGIRTIVFEREKDIYQRARAVTVNDWTLRSFQSVGLDQLLLKDMDPHSQYRWLTYDRKELLRTSVPSSTLGQPGAMAIYQPVMEQTLRDGVSRFSDIVSVRFGQEVETVRQDTDGVSVHTASSVTKVKYVLACDGGSSAIREQLDIQLIGDTAAIKWVVIDARVKRWWPDRHKLTFWSDKDRPVVDIALGLGNHRWEFPLSDDEDEKRFQSTEQLWTLLGSMGVTPEDVDIHQHAFYRHHSRMAECWRRDRILLLGDAAHLMPPWAGQGMQSGIRDAFNLSWKLQAIMSGAATGQAANTLLDSYEIERAPNVAKMTAVSEELGRIIKRQMKPTEKIVAALTGLYARLGLSFPAQPLGRAPFLSSGWLSGKPTKKSAVGKMLPQPIVCSPFGKRARLDEFLGPGFVLLGENCDPLEHLTEAENVAWAAFGMQSRAIRSADQFSQAETDLIDLDGTLVNWMRRMHAKVILIRPDRFVCADTNSGFEVPHQNR